MIQWLILLLVFLPAAHAETVTRTFEGGMDVEITYTDDIIVGRDGVISILVENNGWEDKQGIIFDFATELPIMPLESIMVDRLAQGGSFGQSIKLHIPDDAGIVKHFLNLRYSQSLVANNEAPQLPTFHDLAIPILIKGDARVMVHTKTPE